MFSQAEGVASALFILSFAKGRGAVYRRAEKDSVRRIMGKLNTNRMWSDSSAPLRWAEKTWMMAKTHPFIAIGLMCAVPAFLFPGTGAYLRLRSLLVVFAACGILWLLAIWLRKICGRCFTWRTWAVWMTFALALAGLFAYSILIGEKNVLITLYIGIWAGALVLYSLWGTGRLTASRAAAAIAFVGFSLRLCYVFYTNIYTRSYDVTPWGGVGHLAYIEALLEGKLPEMVFHPEVGACQFYHPPFHHFIMAICLKIGTLLGWAFEKTGQRSAAPEAMQFITLFYAAACLVYFYRLLKRFGVTGRALVVSVAVIAFYPMFILLGGSVNNDILSILLAVAALWYTVQWYDVPTIKNILKIALCIGFGMMTKLSVWMVAPGIATVFLVVWWRERKHPWRCIGQFSLFGLLCAPLGLWWSIRNYLLYKMPPTYVPGMPIDDAQYIGYLSVGQRLSNWDMTNVFHDIPNTNNSNPIVELLKSGIFGEMKVDWLVGWPQVLFWVSVVLAVAAFVAMIALFVKKTPEICPTLKAMLGITYVVIMVSYIIFCFQFPFLCTENARYVMPAIVITVLFFGMGLCRIQHRKKWRWLVRVAEAATALFCACTCVVYGATGLL